MSGAYSSCIYLLAIDFCSSNSTCLSFNNLSRVIAPGSKRCELINNLASILALSIPLPNCIILVPAVDASLFAKSKSLPNKSKSLSLYSYSFVSSINFIPLFRKTSPFSFFSVNKSFNLLTTFKGTR